MMIPFRVSVTFIVTLSGWLKAVRRSSPMHYIMLEFLEGKFLIILHPLTVKQPTLSLRPF
jgi:hypothetical protein